MARPGLLVRRKIIEEGTDSSAIEQVSDNDMDSVTSDFLMASHGDVERALHLAEQGEVSFHDAGGLHYALQQPVPVDCVYVTAKDIEKISDHYIIFIWNRNFDQIIEFLRLRLFSAIRSILLVTDEPLSSTQWFVVGRYVGLKVFLGNPSDTQLLIRAGADRAHGIVVFPQQLHSSNSSNAPVVANGVADSSSILLFNMSKRLKNNVCCFVEVAEKRSFGFLTRDTSLLDLSALAKYVAAMLQSVAALCILNSRSQENVCDGRAGKQVCHPFCVRASNFH